MKRPALIILAILYLSLAVAAQAVPVYESEPCQPARLLGYQVECGRLTVLEDRTDPQSRTLELAVMVIHSRSRTPAPDPVVYLVGGPGGSIIRDAGQTFEGWFKPFAEERDVIFFDQRGTGMSVPALYCEEGYDALIKRLTSELTEIQDAALMQDMIKRCHDRLVGAGINLAAYTSAASAADLNDLRLALGYESWNLLGVSYGSRLALTTMRDFPEGIRSVILDSVYPPQVNLYTELLPNSQRALNVLFAGCRADADCNTAYPDLENVFWTLYDRLNAEPVYIPVETREGNRLQLVLTGDRLFDWMFGWLYNREDIENIPYWLYRLYDGDTLNQEVLRAGLEQEVTPLFIDVGMYYAVQCSEEIHFTDPDAFGPLPEQFPRLRGYIARNVELNGELLEVCAGWETRPPHPVENEAVHNGLPALVLAGEYDPITPPAWAELAAATLPNSFSYTMPGVGHGVIRSSECGMTIARSFLTNPTTVPDAACIATQPAPRFKIVARLQPSVPSS